MRWLTLLFLCYMPCALASQNDIKNYQQSWLYQALILQNTIDQYTPLVHATFIGTHNSFNAKAYQIPLLRYIDPNQIVSITDQLQMGMRTIEFDAHWYINRHMKYDVLLCHGFNNHLGCSPFDRPIADGLAEVRDWLLQHPNEIILLYIEKHLDGHENKLHDLLTQYLGPLIYRPQDFKLHKAGQCQALPLSLSKHGILALKKQVLIISMNCADNESPLNDVIFAGHFKDLTMDMFNDTASDSQHQYWWRIFENRTLYGQWSKKSKLINKRDVTDILAAGFNWLALDKISVDDPRLAQLIWSWAKGYPRPGQGQCAALQYQQGIINVDPLLVL
jgi:hypothetical protein